MLIAFIAACICVITRAILNVCDRQVFKQSNVDFHKSMAMNAIFPFAIALITSTYFVPDGDKLMGAFLLQPGIFFSALGAQLAAYVFSMCFRSMTVRTCTVTAKTADLLIPLVIFLITSKFQASEYFFACLSTLIFIPLLRVILKDGSSVYSALCSSLVLVLLFQAGVNSYFHMNKFADTWPKFFAMMACILFWRTIFMLAPLILKAIKNWRQPQDQKKHVNYTLLAARAVLAFVSQAAFFYSITRVSGAVAWPILNSTPLIACYTAHQLLGEEIGKAELKVLGSFICLSIMYLFIQGR